MAFSGAVKYAEEIQRTGGQVSGYFVGYILSDDSTPETRTFIWTFTGADLVSIITAGATMPQRRARARQLVLPLIKAAYLAWMSDIATRYVATVTDPDTIAQDPPILFAELPASQQQVKA